jgi:hypothetical protein
VRPDLNVVPLQVKARASKRCALVVAGAADRTKYLADGSRTHLGNPDGTAFSVQKV